MNEITFTLIAAEYKGIMSHDSVLTACAFCLYSGSIVTEHC